jgi:hypothetical protein
MTTAQKTTFCELLDGMECLSVLKHGDCIGVDCDAHGIVRSRCPGVTIHIHPPTIDTARAFCEAILGPTQVRTAASDVVVAFPKGEREERRGSGTWAVIRHARKTDRALIVVLPSGTVI